MNSLSVNTSKTLKPGKATVIICNPFIGIITSQLPSVSLGETLLRRIKRSQTAYYPNVEQNVLSLLWRGIDALAWTAMCMALYRATIARGGRVFYYRGVYGKDYSTGSVEQRSIWFGAQQTLRAIVQSMLLRECLIMGSTEVLPSGKHNRHNLDKAVQSVLQLR